MVGAKLVFPGPWLDGKSLHELFETEGVTMSAGVPTVWQGLLDARRSQRPEVQHHEAHRHRRLGLPAGDDAMPSRTSYGVQVMHAWGMTELSPMGTVGTLKGKHAEPGRRRSAGRCRPSRGARCTAST